MAGPGKNYTIGKGKLSFDKFATSGAFDGIGERYLGNTPEITVSQDSETLDHFDADEGLNVKDESVTIEQTMTLNFTTDNIDIENLALWFGADKVTTNTASAVVVAPADFVVQRGLTYQLGIDASNPQGRGNITTVTVTDNAGTPVTIPNTTEENYVVDLVTGRITIKADAPDIADGDTIKIGYTVAAGDRVVLISKGKELRGALRYIATNPVGPKNDYFYPYVKLTPDGDYALKSDEWMTMSFTCEVLKKDSGTERVYLTPRS